MRRGGLGAAGLALGLALLVARAGAAPGAAQQVVTAPEESAGAKAAPEAAIRLSLPTEPLGLGEPFPVAIEVEHPARATVALAAEVSAAPLELLRPPRLLREPLGGDRARTRILLELINFASLAPTSPAVRLRISAPGGAHEVAVSPRPIPFRSQVDLRRPLAEQVRPAKPPVPIWERRWRWLWLLCALAAALGAARFLQLRRRRPAPPATPSERALARIALLAQRAPWRYGAGRAAIFELSQIVRGYLTEATSVPAMDLTRAELLAALEARRPAGLDLAALAADLAWEERVKFARQEPTPAECLAAVERAKARVQALHSAALLAQRLERAA